MSGQTATGSSPSDGEPGPQSPASELLAEFLDRYNGFGRTVSAAILDHVDAVVLARLGDDLDQYLSLVHEHSTIFNPPDFQALCTNIALMQNDVRLEYQQTLNESHHGFPTVVERVHTGVRGRPRVHIDREFLEWAFAHRSISSIARFLGVGRRTVQNALADYGIVRRHTPSASPPFRSISGPLSEGDDLLDPPDHFPLNSESTQPVPHVLTSAVSAALSDISDDGLDAIITELRGRFRRAGISMMLGMLRSLGHHVPRERVRTALLRIDPIHRVFDRIRIRRREYSVPGPNALWHHDGQHGLIRWGIVIHGFIDGYSRLITALRAHNNNRAQTVLDLFMDGAYAYGVPSRLRGDHGTENLMVAAWMEEYRGVHRGSYIWGRSVHNVRIERLWVDVTSQVGAKWSAFFTTLELRHGLDCDNPNHIWLLHYVFLGVINAELGFFVSAWNQHKIQIRHGPNRSPIDMFGFDMLVCGVRGDMLEEAALSDEEIEVFGIDWEALRDERLLQAQAANNPRDEGWSSWLGRVGPPEHLSNVSLESPPGFLETHEIEALNAVIRPWQSSSDDNDLILMWTAALAHLSVIRHVVF